MKWTIDNKLSQMNMDADIYLNNNYETDPTRVKRAYDMNVKLKDISSKSTTFTSKTLGGKEKKAAYEAYTSMSIGHKEGAEYLHKYFAENKGIRKQNKFIDDLTIAIGARLGSDECITLENSSSISCDIKQLSFSCQRIINKNASEVGDKTTIKWVEAIARGVFLDKHVTANNDDGHSYLKCLSNEPITSMQCYAEYITPYYGENDNSQLSGVDYQNNVNQGDCCILL
ncbi:MAG: hypothetical protein HRU35_04115 [Rickettsiaceae bacterium]|nr:hypothetical protein [Rickettsiaceae bacterium]